MIVWKQPAADFSQLRPLSKKIINWFTRSRLRWLTTLIILLLFFVVSNRRFGLMTKLSRVKTASNQSLVQLYYRLTVTADTNLSLDISLDKWQTLVDVRNDALNKGVLLAEDNRDIPALLNLESDSYPVRLRLKGDWLDHLKTDRWSFRVESDSDAKPLGMARFSLQVPETRNFLNEWLFLKILRDEGLISLRYDFVNLTINGDRKGVYALEEHFSKEVIENSQRREGPILKFNEDGFWNRIANFGGQGRFDTLKSLVEGYYFTSLSEAFQESKLADDPALKPSLDLALSKMSAYQLGQLSPAEVFDYETWSTYLALSDVFGARHGLSWHNLRFYFNPVTGLFEPIPFNGNPGERIDTLSIHLTEPGPLTPLINDPLFIKQYLPKLSRFAQQDYVGQKLVEASPQIDRFQKLLKQDYPDYQFDPMNFFENADIARQNFNLGNGLRVISWQVVGNSLTLKLQNLTRLPLMVSGLNSELSLNQPILPASPIYTTPSVQTVVLNFADLPNTALDQNPQLYFSAISAGETHEVPLTLLASPPDYQKQPGISPEQTGFISRQGQDLIVSPGSHQLNRLLVVAPNNRLVINAGTKLDLVNGGSIVSYSPVFIIGSETSPAVIESSDGSGGGLLVINAPERSIVDQAVFNNLNIVNQADYFTTGAVTFYASDVNITNTTFANNASEDALNVVRAEFLLGSSGFSQTFSDAVDIDFGKGLVENSRFADIGNDALDFSGSMVTVRGATINRTGDKGISVGERSRVIIESASFHNLNLGLASKDVSEVETGDLEFNNVNVGVAAYQKKAEFGPSQITMLEFNSSGIKTLHDIEIGSVLNLPFGVVKGESKNLADKYQ